MPELCHNSSFPVGIQGSQYCTALQRMFMTVKCLDKGAQLTNNWTIDRERTLLQDPFHSSTAWQGFAQNMANSNCWASTLSPLVELRTYGWHTLCYEIINDLNIAAYNFHARFVLTQDCTLAPKLPACLLQLHACFTSFSQHWTVSLDLLVLWGGELPIRQP